MNTKEAADFINRIHPNKVIPIHYCMVVGDKSDFFLFKNSILKDIEIEELIKL